MSETEVKCPLCGAEPGVACGNESHPERIELAKKNAPKPKPGKPAKTSKIHEVQRKKRRAA
jgi:hypothetical protein